MILITPENEMQYERWRKKRQVAQKSYQNNAASSTSPALRVGMGNQGFKKQSSFLIDTRKKVTKSFLDLSADDITDTKSDLSAKGGNRSTHIVKLKHQNSSN